MIRFMKKILLLGTLLVFNSIAIYATTFDFESNVGGHGTTTMTQTLTGETLQVTTTTNLYKSSIRYGGAISGLESIGIDNGVGEPSYTITLLSGNLFDLDSIMLNDLYLDGSNLVFTSSKGTLLETLTGGSTTTFDISANVNSAKMQGITSFTITEQGGDGFLGLILDNIVFSNITAPISNDSDATLTAGSTVSEPVNLASTADTSGEAVSLFDFTITDGGGGDNLSTDVSQIVVNTSGTGDFSKVTWRLNGADVSDLVGVYSLGANTLTFSGLSISVADGANETYTVSGYYSTATGLTNNQTYLLSLNGNNDLTLSASGTQMSGGNSTVNNGTGTLVDVTATKLIFETLPSN